MAEDYLAEIAKRRRAQAEQEAQLEAGLPDREVAREQATGAAIWAQIRDGNPAASSWLKIIRTHAASRDQQVDEARRTAWTLRPDWLREDGYVDEVGDGGKVVWSRKS